MMKRLLTILALAAASASIAEVMDRPAGFRIGQRMTVRPYVSMYYTYDSNVDSTRKSSGGGSSWNVQPGFTADYISENWRIMGGAYYQYHAYAKNSPSLNESSYGQNFAIDWSNSKHGGKGWSLTLRESYAKISQDDDMSNHDGRGMGRDRQQFDVAGTIQRRFTEKWHGEVNSSYYYIDYDNDSKKYAPMYGWRRWTVGGQAGFAASQWTDIMVGANYQGYTQDNDRDRRGEFGVPKGRHISDDSKGWTLAAGVGTYATKRISYRVMGGWSRFEYAGGAHDVDGFTYLVGGNWQIADDWSTMLMGTSYYQPSEREYGSAIRVDMVSWGIAHSMIRGKLNSTFNVAYRREQHEYTEYASSDYDEDIVTARLGFNYIVNRFLSVFTSAEYQKCFSDGPKNSYRDYDYDRWRLSLGLRLTY